MDNFTIQLIRMKQTELKNKKEDFTDKMKQDELSKIQNVDEDTIMFLLSQC